MSTPPTPSGNLAFDELDPHGLTKLHSHGHVIIPLRILAGVLLILLFFTVATVFASRVEIFLIEGLGVPIPHWVNVAVALSIATVKSIFVALFFMQLKYDSPLNSLVFLFCLFAFSLFLGFSMLDLGTRGVIEPWKSGEIIKGGTQLALASPKDDLPRTEKTPIVEWARTRHVDRLKIQAAEIVDAAIKAGGVVHVDPLEHAHSHPAAHGVQPLAETVRRTVEDLTARGELADLELQKQLVVDQAVARHYKLEYLAAHHGKVHDEGPGLPSENRTLRRTGLTPGLFDPPSTHDAGGGHGH